jgi:hypothetical protein
MPNRKTVYNWRRQNPEFARAYLLPRGELIDDYAQKTIQIADGEVFSQEQLERNRLRVSTRQWYAERLMKSQFGTKVALVAAVGTPTASPEENTTPLTPAEAYKKMLGGAR